MMYCTKIGKTVEDHLKVVTMTIPFTMAVPRSAYDLLSAFCIPYCCDMIQKGGGR